MAIKFKKSGVVNLAVLRADVANVADNVLADVITFPVKAGKKYRFRAHITYSAAATTTGSRWTVNGPTAPTNLSYRSQYSLTLTSETVNSGLEDYQLPAAANATSADTTDNVAIIEGTITPSVDGNVAIQAASEVAASAITAIAGASFIQWQEL